MKKSVKLLGGITLVSLLAVNVISSSSSADEINLQMENVNAIALADSEGGSSITCDGGRNECARIIRGNEVHLFYMD